MQADSNNVTDLELTRLLREECNDDQVRQFRQLPGKRGEQPADRGVTRRVK